jgi:CBS domain containing-hemolysin-like protein
MKRMLVHSMRWSIFIFSLTFLMGCLFSVASTVLLENAGWGIGMMVVFAIVLIGIVFDMLGIASTAAVETPFHAMAAERVSGSRHAIHIIRNADRFSNFCNDVVGDICSVIGGAASAVVVLKLIEASVYADNPAVYTVVNVLFTAFVSGLTVGGKALGKSMAIENATAIILLIGKMFHLAETRLGIRLFKRKGKSKKKQERG